MERQIANYSELLEEARYRDRLLVEEFSIGFLGTGMLFNIAYYVRDILAAQIPVTIVGMIGFFALAFSLSKLAETRDKCWEQARKQEEGIEELNVRRTIRSGNKTYLLTRLGEKIKISVGKVFVYFMIVAWFGWIASNVYWMIC